MLPINEGLVIEKGIPFRKRGAPGYAYGMDWSILEVGDSVFMPGYNQGRPVDGRKNLNITAIKSSMKEYSFVARTTVKDDVEGVRVWRIA